MRLRSYYGLPSLKYVVHKNTGSFYVLFKGKARFGIFIIITDSLAVLKAIRRVRALSVSVD